MKDTADVIKKWTDALNSGDVNALVEASESDIAIAGPRGTAKGVEVLREWYAHTHLTFDVEELLVHGKQAISLGIAHWHNDEGSETGSANTAFLMKVSSNGRIAELSRHDEGLEAALAASNAPNKSDWQAVETM